MTVSRVESGDAYARQSSGIVDLGPIRPRGRGAYKIEAEAAAPVEEAATESAASPTAPLGRILRAFAITVVVVCILGAQGIAETARTMPGGPAQSVVTTVGDISVAVQGFLHLSWPWRDVEVALGHGVQFSKSSLDAVPTATPIPTATPVPRHHRSGTGSKRPGRGKTPKPKHPSQPWPKLPYITKSHPLNLMVTGDSLPQFMVGQIATLAAAQGPVNSPAPVSATTFPGTGLCRPDAFPWDVQARDEARQFHPQAVVVLMGGNDNQNMVLGREIFTAGTPAWTREYERRAEIIMHIFLANGARRVYWLSMPPPGGPSGFDAHDFHQIDMALQRAAKAVVGVHYVNINPVVTYRGRYVDYKKIGGMQTLIREPDGIHLNIAGSQLVSNMVVPYIKRELKFGWSQVYRRTHPHAFLVSQKGRHRGSTGHRKHRLRV